MTYLYTHYNIDIQAVVNPFTMSWTGGPGAGPPEETIGSFPATTIRGIRHKLLQSRKVLKIIDEGGNVFLETPHDGQYMDVKTGPSPISCSLVNISGARTVMIRWRCEGWIRECPQEGTGGGESPYMISNRWSDQMVINEYQLATRTIIGHVVFDKSFMVDANLQPDNLRAYFIRGLPRSVFPKVAHQFQREEC